MKKFAVTLQTNVDAYAEHNVNGAEGTFHKWEAFVRTVRIYASDVLDAENQLKPFLSKHANFVSIVEEPI